MIDYDHLTSLVEVLGKETMNKIRVEFVDDSTEKMTLLLAAWEAQNNYDIREISHSLKSASLNMAMKDFAAQCQQMESPAEPQSHAERQAIMDNLPALHQASLAELEAYFLAD